MVWPQCTISAASSTMWKSSLATRHARGRGLIRCVLTLLSSPSPPSFFLLSIPLLSIIPSNCAYQSPRFSASIHGCIADIRIQTALSLSSPPNTPQVLKKLEKCRVYVVVSLVRSYSLLSPLSPYSTSYSHPGARFYGLVRRVMYMQLLTALGS